MDASLLIGLHVVIIHPLPEPRRGFLKHGVFLQPRLGLLIPRRDGCCRRNEFGPFVHRRIAAVDVIEEHQRSRFKSQVFHRVFDEKAVLPQLRPDFPRQLQVLPEHAGLPHRALRPHHVFVIHPFSIHIHMLGRDVRDAAVQAQVLAFIGAWRAYIAQAAREHQSPGKRPQPSKPLRLEKGRAHVSGGRTPAKGPPAVLRKRNVHSPTGQHGKMKSRTGSEVHRLHAPLVPFGSLTASDSRDLGNVPDLPEQCFLRQIGSIQFRHSFLLSIG